MNGPRVALIDGPLDLAHPALIERMDLEPCAPASGPATDHATAVAAAMLQHAPGLAIVNLVVFGRKLATSAGCVADALERADSSDASVVHCSFGLARSNPRIAGAVARLVGQGRLVVAAAAARGGPVYPAALPGVVSVQGDARCNSGAWSFLDLLTARFGACPRLDGHPNVGGASIAAAHLTGHLAHLMSRATPDPLKALVHGAAHLGREKRSAAPIRSW